MGPIPTGGPSGAKLPQAGAEDFHVLVPVKGKGKQGG